MITDVTYEISKENFHFLMDCINEYWDTEAPPKRGYLYFIKESRIAELSVSKYNRGTIEHFKAFFCNVVLELHIGTELNIKEYEEYFGNKQGKKYDVRPEKMNSYLNREENLKFISAFLKLAEDSRAFAWKSVFPILLLERLRVVTYNCLREYFTMDEDTFNGAKCVLVAGKKMNSYEETKRELYSRFLMAACLYEIFVKKFLEKDVWEKFFDATDKVTECVVRYENFSEELKRKVEEWKKIKEKSGSTAALDSEVKKTGEEMLSMAEEVFFESEKCVYETSRILFFFLHLRHVMVFYSLVSMIEFVNINNSEDISKKHRKTELISHMDSRLFEKATAHIFFNEFVMNKNNCDIYKQINDILAEEKLIQELCGSSEKKQEKALKLVQEYFRKVKNGADLEDKEFINIINMIFVKTLKEE